MDEDSIPMEELSPEEQLQLAKGIVEQMRKEMGLFSLKNKYLPNYLKKSLKNKEWTTGDALGETLVAK